MFVHAVEKSVESCWWVVGRLALHDVIVSPSTTDRIHRDGRSDENVVSVLEMPTEECSSFGNGASMRRIEAQHCMKARRSRPFQIPLVQETADLVAICIADETCRCQGWCERTVGEDG